MEHVQRILALSVSPPVAYTAGVVAAVGAMYLMRKWCQGGTCYSDVRLDGKTVVITGGNYGIGRYTAYDMARRGARVVLCCRDTEKAQAVAEQIRRDSGNGNVLVKKLDLASLASVRACAADILTTEERVDVLINNAAIMACPYWKTDDGYEAHFGVNHLGHFLFTVLLLDLIKRSAPSRIVNVASSAHSFGTIDYDNLTSNENYSPWPAYGRSKLANILFTRELSRRLKGTGVTTYSLHPGLIRTRLSLHVPAIIRVPCFGLFWFVLKSEKQGAQTTIHCAVMPGLEQYSGLYFSDCHVRQPSAAARNDEAAARLWDVSEKLVCLSTVH